MAKLLTAPTLSILKKRYLKANNKILTGCKEDKPNYFSNSSGKHPFHAYNKIKNNKSVVC
jgi:hypothetical protein